MAGGRREGLASRLRALPRRRPVSVDGGAAGEGMFQGRALANGIPHASCSRRRHCQAGVTAPAPAGQDRPQRPCAPITLAAVPGGRLGLPLLGPRLSPHGQTAASLLSNMSRPREGLSARCGDFKLADLNHCSHSETAVRRRCADVRITNGLSWTRSIIIALAILPRRLVSFSEASLRMPWQIRQKFWIDPQMFCCGT